MSNFKKSLKFACGPMLEKKVCCIRAILTGNCKDDSDWPDQRLADSTCPLEIHLPRLASEPGVMMTVVASIATRTCRRCHGLLWLGLCLRVARNPNVKYFPATIPEAFQSISPVPLSV